MTHDCKLIKYLTYLIVIYFNFNVIALFVVKTKLYFHNIYLRVPTLLSLMIHFYRLSRLDEPEQKHSVVNDQETTKTASDPLTNNKPSTQQGTTPTQSNCYGQWSTPKGCNVSAGQCEYHVVWTYSSKTDYMRFTITTTHTNTWTGIGFSDDHKMVNIQEIASRVNICYAKM